MRKTVYDRHGHQLQDVVLEGADLQQQVESEKQTYSKNGFRVFTDVADDNTSALIEVYTPFGLRFRNIEIELEDDND